MGVMMQEMPSGDEGDGSKGGDRPEHPLYAQHGPGIQEWKIRGQMVLGLTIPALFMAKAAYEFHLLHIPCSLRRLVAAHPLHIVAYVLALSAGLELAYMLFTDGPDEAVEPVILGMAATLMLLISDDSIRQYPTAFAVLVCTASLGFLFWVRGEFVEKRRSR